MMAAPPRTQISSGCRKTYIPDLIVPRNCTVDIFWNRVLPEVFLWAIRLRPIRRCRPERSWVHLQLVLVLLHFGRHTAPYKRVWSACFQMLKTGAPVVDVVGIDIARLITVVVGSGDSVSNS